jgi:hypothetical protein
VLLGSLATGKYLDILTPVFASRLRVPAEFIGRGDMSRGGLLLRCVRQNRELDYIDAAILSASINKRSRMNKPIPRSWPSGDSEELVRVTGPVAASGTEYAIICRSWPRFAVDS